MKADDHLGIVRRARDLARDAINEALPDGSRARAMSSLDALTLRHGLVMADFDELRRHEQDQADKAAAYLSSRGITKDGWGYPDLLAIARGVAVGDEKFDAVLIALQDNIVALGRQAFRDAREDRKPKVTHLRRDIAA